MDRVPARRKDWLTASGLNVARVVSPWTWAKALRDHGPKDRDFLCAMFTLRTYMDTVGFAYPSLRTWAAGTRMSVNTLRKHVSAAAASGWLSIESRAGQRRERMRNVYRCTIPGFVELSATDEQIAEALCSKHGELPESLSESHTERLSEPFEGPSKGLATSTPVSTISDTDSDHRGVAVSSHADTDATVLRTMAKSDSDRAPSVSNPLPVCVKDTADLYQKRAPSVSSHVDTEVLKFLGSSLEGASASARTNASKARDVIERESGGADATISVRLQRARKLLEAAPTTAEAKVAAMYNLTIEQVRQVRDGLVRPFA